MSSRHCCRRTSSTVGLGFARAVPWASGSLTRSCMCSPRCSFSIPLCCHKLSRQEWLFSFLATSPVSILLLFGHSVASDSLQPQGPQHARPPITNSHSLPKLMSTESVMPSNHLILCRPLLFLTQSFPASGSFQMSQLFAPGGQSIRVSTSTSVLPMNTQD